jgi:DNA polymerase-3 subunit delta
VEPQQILAMLIWQLHILAVVKTAGPRSADTIAKEAKISPFTVRKSVDLARRLSLTQLKTRVSDLLKIDLDLKSKSMNADEALQLYLLRLA